MGSFCKFEREVHQSAAFPITVQSHEGGGKETGATQNKVPSPSRLLCTIKLCKSHDWMGSNIHFLAGRTVPWYETIYKM